MHTSEKKEGISPALEFAPIPSASLIHVMHDARRRPPPPPSCRHHRCTPCSKYPISRERRGQTHRAVGTQSGDVLRYCSSPPPKEASTPGCPHWAGERYPTSHDDDTSQLNRVRHQSQQPTPLPPSPPSFCLVPLAPSKFRAKGTEKVASIQTLYTHRRRGSPSPPLENTNKMAKPTTPTSQDLNPTRQHLAELSCLLPPAPRVSPSRVLPPPPPIHLRYPTAVRPLDITQQPACQPAPSESESRPLLGILCSLPSAASML